MSINELIQEKLEEMENNLDRGEYFLEKGDISSAFESFNYGISSYYWFIMFNQNGMIESTSKSSFLDTLNFPRDSAKIRAPLLIVLCRFLCNLAKSCEDKVIKAYIFEKIYIVVECLGTYQKFLNRDDLETYDALQKGQDVRKISIDIYATQLEQLKQKTKDEVDSGFDLLRESLASISSLDIFPVKLEESKRETQSSSCFIATAAYATSEHPDLDTFRHFRDQFLLTNSGGRLAVNIYYRVGPHLATFVKSTPLVQQNVRRSLEFLAQKIRG